MAGEILQKVNRRIERLKKDGMPHKRAWTEAWKEYRAGKIAGPKKKVVRPRHIPKKTQRSGPLRKRIGAVADPTLAQSIALTKKKLVERLGWATVNRDNAKTRKAYKKHAADVLTIKSKIRALS